VWTPKSSGIACPTPRMWSRASAIQIELQCDRKLGLPHRPVKALPRLSAFRRPQHRHVGAVDKLALLVRPRAAYSITARFDGSHHRVGSVHPIPRRLRQHGLESAGNRFGGIVGIDVLGTLTAFPRLCHWSVKTSQLLYMGCPAAMGGHECHQPRDS
jgi:hypothetical protein